MWGRLRHVLRSRSVAMNSFAAFAMISCMNAPLRSVLGAVGKTNALRLVCSALQVRFLPLGQSLLCEDYPSS